MNRLRRARGDVRIVRRHDQRHLAFFAQGAQQVDDFLAGVGIQIAGRFIRQNQVPVR